MTRRARIGLALAGLAVALAACGGTQMSTIIETIGDGPMVAAQDLVFDRTEIEVPAGEAFELTFDNREAVPHNVAIYADDAATQPLYVGAIFSGPATRVYQLPALAPGAYLFRCDVHQDMKGSLVATP